MDASQDAAAAVHVVVHPVGRQVSPSDVEPMHREVVGMDSLPSSVRAAREVIRRVLDSLDPERAERAAEDIVIAVADGSREPPRPRTALDDDPTGRGTLIIDRLADRWGVDFLPGGKQVWCRISLGAEDRMVRA